MGGRIATAGAALLTLFVLAITCLAIVSGQTSAATSASTNSSSTGCQRDSLRRFPLSRLVRAVHRRRTTNNVWMSRAQQGLIEAFLDPRYVMLEYGSGYSTMWFSQFVSKYYSIEHNVTWGYAVQDMVVSDPKVSVHIVPAKPHTPGFRAYVSKPKDFGVQRFDAVLIDGRNRVDCAQFILQYIDENSVVFLHDYFERPRYHSVEKFYDVIGAINQFNQGQSLVVLRKKKTFTRPPLRQPTVVHHAGFSVEVSTGKKT